MTNILRHVAESQPEEFDSIPQSAHLVWVKSVKMDMQKEFILNQIFTYYSNTPVAVLFTKTGKTHYMNRNIIL